MMIRTRVSGRYLAGIVLGLIVIVALANGAASAVQASSANGAGDGGAEDFETLDLHAPDNFGAVGISGAQHWAVLMCKFSDVGAEPQTAAFFEQMFSRPSAPSLEEYWQEASYENITNLTAEAFGWFALPGNRASYGYSETTPGFDVNSLVQDCIDTANATVNFADFDAVSVMLNSPAPVAIATLYPLVYPDGAAITLGAIAIPSNKFNLALVAHEMGHAYGLPHSFANGQAYTNPWDLMGIASGYRCSVNEDPTYSCLGQHPIAYYKYNLGWLAPHQVFEAPAGASTVTIERLALPQTNNPLLVVVEGDGVFYTAEARMRAGYDAKLPGDAVIIHRNGDNLVDADGAAPHDDAGAMWLPGETFSDEQNGVEIRVDSATATGFTITITREGEPEPGVNLLSSSVSPVTANAGERVDFEWQLNYEDGASGSAAVTINVTLPPGINYVPGSIEVEGPYSTQIDSEDPLVVSAGALSVDALTIRYAGIIDSSLTTATWLTVPLQATWPEGSSQFDSMLLANGNQTFLPAISR